MGECGVSDCRLKVFDFHATIGRKAATQHDSHVVSVAGFRTGHLSPTSSTFPLSRVSGISIDSHSN